jgi:sialic acid synthase SpsE/mannose-6-phosphate isomerase-like protein (cupin superfamily)
MSGKTDFDFTNLFIFDLANNHQGDLAHAEDIIRSVGEVVKQAGIRGGIKFQFRDLDTFIHPDHKDSTTNKHIPRFLGTRLSPDDYGKLCGIVRACGMHTICTPFDEASVDLIEKLDIEIIKIASCSAADRPLLTRIAATCKPIIASTAGLKTNEIDFLVNLFEAKELPLAIMHCVAVYPTRNEQLRLNSIDILRNRYPNHPIGWSTHEDQDDMLPIQIAYAKGARLFERHVGKASEKYALNAYSSNPDQLSKWIQGYMRAVEACGPSQRPPAFIEEIASLNSLKRGVYAARSIVKGEKIDSKSVFFAMPLQEGQLQADYFSADQIADCDYELNAPLSVKLYDPTGSDHQTIIEILTQVRGLLNNAHIVIGEDSKIELSHHYGLERFREFGCLIIDCINREYCKKLIVVLPRQKHPYHYHKRKEETFQLLYGDLEVELDGERKKPEVGQTILVEKGKWHKFSTLHGAIFEEVSTTHYNDDSFYEDERIALISRERRKTQLSDWRAAISGNLKCISHDET